MTGWLRRHGLAALGLLLLVAGTWWWMSHMQRVQRSVPWDSEAARSNPMLAASRWLALHGYAVRQEKMLDTALRGALPKGVIVLQEREGVLTEADGRRLLAWVAGGGMLMLPAREWPDGEAPDDDDPVGGPDVIDQWLDTGRVTGKAAAKAKEPLRLTIPGSSYPLRVADRGAATLVSGPDAPPALWGGAENRTLRVFAHGRGRIVLFDRLTIYFNNRQLGAYDHAELLLRLVGMQAEKQVLWVESLAMPPWHVLLRQYFGWALMAAALALVALLWRIATRFGPLLPPPVRERRALLEHIEASGRWYWQRRAGREQLLGALREAARRKVGPRNPALTRLDRLAGELEVPQAVLTAALCSAAAEQPQEFTRQVEALQMLRSRLARTGKVAPVPYPSHSKKAPR